MPKYDGCLEVRKAGPTAPDKGMILDGASLTTGYAVQKPVPLAKQATPLNK